MQLLRVYIKRGDSHEAAGWASFTRSRTGETTLGTAGQPLELDEPECQNPLFRLTA